MRIPGNWEDWAEYDSDGFVCGIKDEAPEEAKKAYNEYVKEKEQAQEKGIKL